MVDLVDIEATRMRMNDGQFDTDARYMQTAASGTISALLEGPSLALGVDVPPLALVSWRFQVGSYNVRGYYDAITPVPPSSVTNTDTEFYA
jgi:hypothetical protein